MVYEHVQKPRAKSVAFAPMVRIRKIPAGEGTWENGQPVAATPSDWETNNGERLAAQALKEIEEQERAESASLSSVAKVKTEASGPSKLMPKRKPVPNAIYIPQPASRPRASTYHVTFDSFLPQENVHDHGPLKTSTSMKSFASVASIKSWKQKFNAKLRMK